MGRGVSSGGGQSSLNYLFGSGEPNPTSGKTEAAAAPPAPAPVKHVHVPAVNEPPPKPTAVVPQPDSIPKIPAGVQGSQANNYFRAEGQNTGNFLTDRPSTKVHAAPGGGSSLDYLFGGAGGSK
ncbi:protein SPIRAL1-like 3 [Rutidosis leptorrhynchoides]|uniref:protein SPIRAL1-like 3 n=1 Tax=Rutidosis leptorrhynchoides TaxID=125765 RepID=UPI003A99EC80